MIPYIEELLKEFPLPIKGKTTPPWTEKLFTVPEGDRPLDATKSKIFHGFVMKAMFLSQRTRTDLAPAVAFLSTHTKAPTQSDWDKLVKLLEFLKGTKDDKLCLWADDSQSFYFYCDVSNLTVRSWEPTMM